MASVISASTTSATALNMSADTTGVLQLATGATPTTAVTIDTSQNVGIGTTSPSGKLDVSGVFKIQSNGDVYGATGNAGSILLCGGSSYNAGGSIKLFGSSSDNAVVFHTGSFSERMRIDSTGNVSITQTPGKYTVDTTGGATVIANGGTVDFPTASGMLVVNNYTSGAVTIWLCGGGSTNAVSTVGTTVGSFTYVPGINGYRWTNNYGSSTSFGFFFVRTRQGA